MLQHLVLYLPWRRSSLKLRLGHLAVNSMFAEAEETGRSSPPAEGHGPLKDKILVAADEAPLKALMTVDAGRFHRLRTWGNGCLRSARTTTLAFARLAHFFRARNPCEVIAEYLAVPEVAECLPQIQGQVMKIVPNGSRKGFYLHPWQLSFSEDAKFGKFPPNISLKTHLPSFLNRGFETEREPLDVRFGSLAESSEIGLFSVQYVDGHTKGLLVQLIFALLAHCVQSLEEDTPGCDTRLRRLNLKSWLRTCTCARLLRP